MRWIGTRGPIGRSTGSSGADPVVREGSLFMVEVGRRSWRGRGAGSDVGGNMGPGPQPAAQVSTAHGERSPDRLRIGLLANTPGFFEGFFTEIVQRWRAGGHQVFLAAGPSTSGPPTEAIRTIPGITRRPRPVNRTVPAELRDWVRTNDLDLVLTNTAIPSALVRVARVPVPVVYLCHGLHWDRPRLPDLPYLVTERMLLGATAGVVTMNRDDDAWFARHGPGLPRIRLSGGIGLDPVRYAPRPFPVGPTLRLAWIGEFSARKNPPAAVEVAHLLRAGGVPFQLTMMGDGGLHEATARRIAALDLESVVELPGFGDAAALLTGVHAVIHTAAWEGLPRVLLEAYAIGRRTFAFDTKGVRDVPGVRLVRNGDVRALAAAVAGEGMSPPVGAPHDLSYRQVADELLAFLSRIAADRRR